MVRFVLKVEVKKSMNKFLYEGKKVDFEIINFLLAPRLYSVLLITTCKPINTKNDT